MVPVQLLQRFRNAVLEGAERPALPDNVLHPLSIPTLLAHPPLDELSPLERLVFCAAFLALLFPSSSAPSTGAERALGLDAVKVVRQVLPPALDELGKPAQSVHDLAELSPVPTSRLLSILLSDICLGNAPPAPTESANLRQALTDNDRRSVVLAAVHGRLGSEVGAQALAPVLCSLELARAVLAKSGSLGGDGDGVEIRIAQQHFDMISLAQRKVDAGCPGGDVDVDSRIRAMHVLHPTLRWGDVVRGFDSPLRAPAEGPLAVRALAAALQLPPATAAHAGQPARQHAAPARAAPLRGLRVSWAIPGLQFPLVERLAFLASAPLESQAGSAAAAPEPPFALSALTTTLVRMANEQGELAPRVHELLDRGCKTIPKLVLMALTQIKKPWNAMHGKLVAPFLSTFLAGHQAHQLVFLRLHHVDRQFPFAALRDFYVESEMNVTRIVDIAQDLKALDQVLELRPFVLALDLAALASRREYLNLNKWLSSQPA
ncbi:hypothetical protein Rhopal_006063-T1 [Rhodotorula paludigena]|uniref:CCR4-NOT transcription complex subunit 1 HEAT repeat domain-containing protein n=1 Tax=Rhodotorula paludigena TaxID=86838 RepID=A0AAV5GS11_9BASI|nr:hypothetical protein Rhopal_006063-T1 [Rhodotorula paludigena]